MGRLMADPALIQKLQDQVQVAYQEQTQAIIASANARLTRPLADGLRSEGHLTAASVAKVLLLPHAIRLDVRASGDLRFYMDCEPAHEKIPATGEYDDD